MKKITISTGGTGGHVIPAQVLYDYLSYKNDIIIACDNRGIKYLNKKKYKIKQINVPKLYKNLIGLIPFLISFILSVLKSYSFLKKKKNRISDIYRRLHVYTHLFSCQNFKFKDFFI